MADGAGLGVAAQAGARTYPVDVVALVVSPGHSYWFHSRDPRDGVGPHPTLVVDEVLVEAGLGIAGDRFHGATGGLSSAVSFVAAEAVEEVGRSLGSVLDPVLLRRNVVLRGADLNALRHGSFALDTGDGPVTFAAAGETSPCAWMDAVLGQGARDQLRGRGGLRTTPTSTGRLRTGPGVLTTSASLDPALAGAAVRRRARLP